MRMSQRLLCVAMTACVATAWSQSSQREPHLGYLYPAGGRQGTVCLITVGGQFLQGANKVYISGEGAQAKVIQYYRPVRNIMAEQRQELMQRLNAVRAKRLAELPGKGLALTPAGREFDQSRAGKRFNESFPGKKFDQKSAPAKTNPAKGNDAATKSDAAKTSGAARTAPFRPVEHPLLYNLENKNLRELQHIAYQLFFPRQKKQMNAQIDEMALIEVTIAPDAAPGDRELRLETALGLTNPMVFQVGQLPEIRELEPNDPVGRVGPVGQVGRFAPGRTASSVGSSKAPPLELPVVLNGQIMPGDVDPFSFRARKGQRLVMAVSARRLVPYLADAVPGWFQATLALYDAKGKEIAFADDYRFDPDPVLFYEIPQDGEYELEIRDSIYRGREDFVYRVAVGEQPFITGMYPLGARSGAATVASVAGWNLTKTQLPLDTQSGADSIRHTALRQDKWLSNEVAYNVDTLPECNEIEPNNNAKEAQRITLPQIVNGRIAPPGDVDVFRFEGRAGDQVVAEVLARRLRSPLDSLLRLTDASGRVLAWNDDHEDKEMGLLTHQADSYLCTRLPQDGVYYVQLSDSEQHGGEEYGYRLRLSPRRPDFALRVTPSSLNVPVLGTVPICVYALRKDGFDGDIELVLKDAPAGFTLAGGRIPKGRDRVHMTLTASGKRLEEPVVLQLEGRAAIGGQTVSRPVVPAEDMMQAFAYRHLVPSRELMVAVRRAQYPAPPAELAGGGPVRIPAGGATQVRINIPRRPALLQNIQLALSDPPKGVTLQDVTVLPGGLTFALKADGAAARAGFADNLIVEAFTEMAGRGPAGKAAAQRQRVSLGVLPAIPFEIVQR